jgi:hypothetical protein
MRWRKKWGLCLLACLFLPGCSRCQTGDDVARCQSTDPDIRISGCTALINSNTLQLWQALSTTAAPPTTINANPTPLLRTTIRPYDSTRITLRLSTAADSPTR